MTETGPTDERPYRRYRTADAERGADEPEKRRRRRRRAGSSHAAATAPAPETLVVGPPDAPAAARQPRFAAARRRLQATGPWWAWAIAGAVVVLVVALGTLQGHLHDRAAYGVTVGGQDVGGRTREQVADTVREIVAQRGVDSVFVQTADGVLDVPLAQLGLHIDAEATADAAVAKGRVGWLPWLHLWYGGGGEVQPSVRFEPAAYQAGLGGLRPGIDKAPRDAALTLRGSAINVRPAVDGVAIDEVAFQRALLAQVGAWKQYNAAAATRPAAPAVGTSEVRAAAAEASTYLVGPLRLRYRGRVVELSPGELASMLSVNEGDDAAEYPLTFENPKARDVLHRRFRFAETLPVEAKVIVKGKDVLITRSRDGFGLDMPRLLSDMTDAASRQGLREVVVPLAVLHPRASTEELVAMGVTGLGSQFSTFFDPENTTRAGNIAQAAKLVDGYVIKPGAIFSLNQALGPRTINRGFDYAPVIVDGVLRLGVGGGVCQFATTMFNAAFFAGLPIVERHPHTFLIDHYPIGRDAAVAWGAYDLAFKNDTDHALLVRSWTSNGELSIVLVGSTGREVSYTTSDLYDVRPVGTSKANPRVIFDETLASGIVSWEKGYDGCSVKVVRTVTEGGTVVSHDTFVSTYAPKDWIKRIGTR